MLLKQFVKHLMGTLTSYSPNGVLNSYVYAKIERVDQDEE